MIGSFLMSYISESVLSLTFPFIIRNQSEVNVIGGFPKLGVPFLGVPIIRTIIFWGLYWGPLVLGNYQLRWSSGSNKTAMDGNFGAPGMLLKGVPFSELLFQDHQP